jgi:hypothetical protein
MWSLQASACGATAARRLDFGAPEEFEMEIQERRTPAEAGCEAIAELGKLKAENHLLEGYDLGHLETVLGEAVADETHGTKHSGISVVGNQGIGKSTIQNSLLRSTCNDPIAFRNSYQWHQAKLKQMIATGELSEADEAAYVRFTSLESVRDLQFETLSEARSVQFEALSADEKDQIRKLDIITPKFSAVERAAIREQKYESDDKLRRFSDTESAWSKKVRLFALPSKAEGRATTVIPKMICHGKVPQLLVR